LCEAGADPGVVGPGAYTILGAFFKKKIKVMNTNLGNVSIYLE